MAKSTGLRVTKTTKEYQALQGIMRKCLKECLKTEATSIAFPALGAGNLNFPPQCVARIMVDEISKFWSSHRPATLKVIHLVIYMPETYKAFESKLASVSTTHEPLEDSDDEQPLTLSQPASPSATTDDTATFGNITVQLIQGDITEDSSDALVNTTNSSLVLQGGVSGAIASKGGAGLQSECDKISKQGLLKEGKVAVTPATGMLKSKSIFHVVLESKDPQKLIKVILACLKKAEKRKYHSVAFPALGTGSHGLPPEDAAQGMIQGIKVFASSRHTHLSCVRIVLSQPNMYQAFSSALHNPGEPSSASGLINRVGSYLGSFLPPWSSTVTASPSLDADSSDDESETPFGTTLSQPAEKELVVKEMEVTIYGATETSVQNAKLTLIKAIDDHIATERVDIPNMNFSRRQINELQAMSSQKQVAMEINPFPLNYIIFRGNIGDVAKLKEAVYQAVRKSEAKANKEQKANFLHRTVRWKRQDSHGLWVEYDPITNFEIEEAHHGGFPSFTHKERSDHFVIDFNTLEETDFIAMSKCKVKRVDLMKDASSHRPQHWEPIPLDPSTKKEYPIHVVDLKPGDKEYTEVMQEFNKSMNQGTNYNSIVCIQRVQTPALYGQYFARKRTMDQQNLHGQNNERQLFHGTGVDTVPKINLQGFNRSFAGLNATLYGRGVYFARDASYSARPTYSPQDANGQKYIYLARVLTGVYTKGDSSMLVPPPRDPSKDQNLLYDSVVDRPSDPEIFVVFQDAQAYPEYLITFK